MAEGELDIPGSPSEHHGPPEDAGRRLGQGQALVRGPGATAFLDHFTCNKLPNVGRINLTYALTDHGTTRTEYTIVRLKQDEYYLISAGAWTAYDADFLMKSAEDFVAAGGFPYRD